MSPIFPNRIMILLSTIISLCLAAPSSRTIPRFPLDLLLRGDPIHPHIVGGVVADPNEFPFQISLQKLGLLDYSHACGGSVLNESWIITACHCVDGTTPFVWRVVAGEHSLSVESGDEQIKNVNRIIHHPLFDATTFRNDICLLHLASPLNFTTGIVGPIRLPDQGQETPAGTMTTVTGWGYLHPGDLFLPDRLHKADVPIVSDEECRLTYGQDIVDTMICAGKPEGGVDSCNGDSGGPLFIQNTSELVGIVSWGIGCAQPGIPGVYTQVSYFVDWINENL